MHKNAMINSTEWKFCPFSMDNNFITSSNFQAHKKYTFAPILTPKKRTQCAEGVFHLPSMAAKNGAGASGTTSVKIENHADPELLAGDIRNEFTLAKACLAGYFDPSLKPADEDVASVSARPFFELLRLNKVARIAEIALGRGPSKAPGDYLSTAFDAYRRRTLSLNLASLAAGFEAAGALRAADIGFAFMKGPVQQKLIYGDAFIKPAGDVDLVVSRADFGIARTALGTIGYTVSSQSASSWWFRFLGEQHMTAPTRPAAATLDLHYRLQQPGSPSPRSTEDFLARRSPVSVSGQEVMFMSDMDIALLASMSVAKALFNREPSAGYVCDIRAATLKLGPDAADVLLDHARQAGLLQTLLLGLRAADLLLGMSGGSLSRRAAEALPRVGGDDLAWMIMAPWRAGLDWPKRRHILWDLCGRNPWRYAAEGTWLAAADIGRRIVEPNV